MAGSNALPVALADTASVFVDGATQVSGDVLANDSDADGDPISVTAVNGLMGNLGQTLVGTYGSLILDADGQYVYVLATGQANVRALAAGQLLTRFRLTISPLPTVRPIVMPHALAALSSRASCALGSPACHQRE